MLIVSDVPRFVRFVDCHFVAAPTPESQASDALLAVAKMPPLPAVAKKHVVEEETKELKNEVRS